MLTNTNNSKSLGNILVNKGFWLYLFTYLAAPAGYLTRILFSNSLSIQDVGVLYSIIGFFSILSIYNGLGLTESLKYYLPKYLVKKDYSSAKTVLFSSVFIQFLTSIVVVIAVFFSVERLGLHYFDNPNSVPLLKIFLLYFIATNAIQIFTNIALSLQDTFSSELITFLKSWITVIIVCSLFFLKEHTLLYYGGAFVFSICVVLIIAMIIYVKNYNRIFMQGKIDFTGKVLKSFLVYSFWTFLSMNATLLLWQIDLQMVISILGSEAAGIFTNYISLASLSQIVVSPLILLLFPLVSELFEKKKLHEIAKLQNFFYTYLGFFSCCILGFLIVMGEQIAVTLYGIKFLSSGTLLYVGGVGILFQTLISINFAMLAGLGYAKEKVWILLVMGPLNVLMNIVFITVWGLSGVVVSTVLGLVIMFLRSGRYLRKILHFSINSYLLKRNILLVIVVCFTLHFSSQILFDYTNTARIHNLFILLGAGVFYCLTLFLWNYTEFLELKNQIVTLRKE